MAILLTIAPMIAQAEIIGSGEFGADGDNLTWTLDDTGTLIISGKGGMDPDLVPWSDLTNKIKNVIISKGVTTIENFSLCNLLIDVSIPDSVTYISSGAFWNCSSLTSISIPDSVTDLGACTFENCSSLRSAYISDNVTAIYSGTFRGCSSLTSISIPKSVTEIDEMAFYECFNLTDVYYSGSKEDWQKIEIYSYNNHLKNAAIHFGSEGLPPTPDPSEFKVNQYRADFLLKDMLGSTMENTYFNINNTPSNILYQAAKDSDVLWQANAWKAFSDTIDAVDSPSKLLDYSVEEKDMYSAIIFNMFESSTDYKLMQCIDNEAVKETKNLVSNVTSIMKDLYNYDMLEGMDISKLDDIGKKNLRNAIDKAFEQEHGNAKDIGKLTSVIGSAIDYGKDLQQCCEIVSSYYQIYMLNDAMKSVMQEMLNKCPLEEKALRSALKDCVAIMNAGGAEFANDMAGVFCSMAGKNITQFLMDKMWDKVKDKVYLAHPGVYVIMSAYKIGKYASNVIFNVDDITEKLFKLEAMVKSESVLDSAYKSVKSKYKSDKTEEKAEVYNNAIDVMFNALDTDCDYALAYVNSIDSSVAGKIDAALGDTNCAEMKKSISSIQNSYAIEHASVLTAWIYELENDYPELYPQYEKLVDDTYTKIVKKYNINCPVDVYVYNADGIVEGSVINNVPHCSEDKNITIAVNGDRKTIYFYDNNDYDIVYVGSDTGTMDIAVTKYDDSGNETRNVYFNDIALSDGLTYSSKESAEAEYTIVDENSGKIYSDYDTQNSGSAAYKASVKGGYFSDFALSAQLHSGENAEISAYVPIGYKFNGWTSDAGDIFADAGSVITTVCMPDKDINITANIVECPMMTISDIQDNSVTVKAVNCGAISGGTIILAVYNTDGTLKNVFTKEFKEEETFDGIDFDGGSIKAMLWDGVNTMTPLAEASK